MQHLFIDSIFMKNECLNLKCTLKWFKLSIEQYKQLCDKSFLLTLITLPLHRKNSWFWISKTYNRFPKKQEFHRIRKKLCEELLSNFIFFFKSIRNKFVNKLLRYAINLTGFCPIEKKVFIMSIWNYVMLKWRQSSIIDRYYEV